MKYIQIKAGLGNQLFQYAFGRALSIEQKTPLALDISWYSNISPKDTPRTFVLDKYKIQAHIATPNEVTKFYSPLRRYLRKISRRLVYKKDHIFHPQQLRTKSSFMEGHWTNEKYFKKHADIIRSDIKLKESFTPVSQALLEQMKEYKDTGLIPISVHIRRGDCVTNSHAASYQGTVDTSYYDIAYAHLSSKMDKDKFVFYISSDDIAWVEEHILLDKQRIFVSRPEIPDYEEILIMSSCEHHIIGNSSYSWWGAWLNPNPDKIVIAPKEWLKDKTFDTSDVCPKEWVRI